MKYSKPKLSKKEVKVLPCDIQEMKHLHFRDFESCNTGSNKSAYWVGENPRDLWSSSDIDPVTK